MFERIGIRPAGRYNWGRFVALPVVAACLALPSAASGATAGIRTDFGSYMVYQGSAGEQNRVSIRVDTAVVTFTDPVGVQAGSGCHRPDPANATVVQCPRVTDPDVGDIFIHVEVLLGDRDDSASALWADTGRLSGEGFTTLTGTMSLEGGPGKDTLTGGFAPGVYSGAAAGFIFVGGPGNDAMTGTPGGGDIFLEGDTANGSDTIRGGSGLEDQVSYGGESGGVVEDVLGLRAPVKRRKRGVQVDLAGDRDDGAKGERDLVGSDIEAIDGTSYNDRITGNRRGNGIAAVGGNDRVDGKGGKDGIEGGSGRDRLFGSGGSDSIEAGAGADRISGGTGKDGLDGGSGPDRIVGGPGRDVISGSGGNDRIYVRDHTFDRVDCGAGSDRVDADRGDGLKMYSGKLRFLRCEQVARH